MTEPTPAPGLVAPPPGAASARTRRRQYLLLGGIVAAILAGTALSVSLTGGSGNSEPAAKPRTTTLLAPGAQVDPRDAWRGQADAQLKAIEQRSRELSQREAELTGQSRDMMERLQRLESGSTGGSTGRTDASGLTRLPPPPMPAPPLRPGFGPDPLPSPNAGPPPQALPAPGPQPALRASPAGAAPVPPAVAPGMPAGGIVSITLGEPPAAKVAKAEPRPDGAARDTRRYLPSGSFTRAVLLGGLDAPTGGQAQRDPQPVLLRLMDHAVLPNQFRGRIRECFVVGAGYGDISAERAYIRTESLSCVLRDGSALDVPIKGYVAGEDGKAGMRGRLVSKQGQLLANALLAGVASGIGTAFQQTATTIAVSPLGATGTVDPDKQLQAGLGTGIGRAVDRLAQYYITLAEKVFPVIEVDAGRTVDVVLTQGVALAPGLDTAASDALEHAQLARRASAQASRRNLDEDDED